MTKSTIYALLVLGVFLPTSARAEDPECCGSEPYPQEPEVCCNDTVIDPTESVSKGFSFNLSPLYNKAKSVSDLLVTFTGSGCKFEGDGALSVSWQGTLTQECCSGEVKDLEETSGDIKFDLGKIDCQVVPTAGIIPPWFAFIGGTLEFTGSIDIKGLSFAMTCEELAPSLDLTGVSGSGIGGLEVNVASGLVRIIAGAEAGAHGGITVTLNEGSWELSQPLFTATGDWVVTARALGDTVTLYEFREPIW